MKKENEAIRDLLDNTPEPKMREIHEGFSLNFRGNKWIGVNKMPDMPRYEWYRCSRCGFLSQSVTNYCANCGARMI
jgi:hypothetical protein